MNKNYNLKLDLQFRCNNSIMKFNQFDNETSDFFIRITNGGKLFDIEKAIVVLAVIKPNKEVDSQFVEVENGVVYANLKPSMKDEIGIYTARAMLILESERVVTDVISYEVEEDKIFSLLNDTVETTEEFTLLTDMLSRLSTIEISEEQRMINETERILSEENRKIEETKRVEAEQLRKDNYNFMTEDEERRRSEANAHKEAEALRVQAETNRVNNENTRKANETTRQTNETHRVEAETQRQNRYNSFIADAETNASNFENYTNTAKVKEEERKANELDRQVQEAKRISNENTRIESEKQRVNAENLRKEKIIEIQSDYDSLKKIIIDENASVNLQNQINQTNSQLEQIANKGTTVEVLERVTKEEINRQIQDGTVANLTIANRSIDDEKIKINGVSLNRVKDFSINLNLIKDFNFVNKRDLNYNTGEITTSNDNRIWTSDYYLIDTSLKNKDILFGNFAEGSINTYYSVYDIDKNFIRGGFLGRTRFSDNECYFVLKVLIITPPSGYGNYLETVYDCIYFGENKVSLESKMKAAKTPYLSEIRVKEDNGLVNVWATRLDDNILLSNSNIENFLSKENYIKSNILEVGDNLFDINSALPKTGVNADGQFVPHNSRYAIQIPIEPDTDYAFSTKTVWDLGEGYWLDEYFSVISKVVYGVETQRSPLNARYFRGQKAYTGDYIDDKVMFCKGTELKPYVPYSCSVNKKYLPFGKTSKDWSNYRYLSMGDSRTVGYMSNFQDISKPSGWRYEKAYEDISDYGWSYPADIKYNTGINLTNAGSAGSTFAKRQTSCTTQLELIQGKVNKDLDIITIHAGTNDQVVESNPTSAQVLVDNTEDLFDITTFKGSIRATIKYIRLIAPYTPILFLVDTMNSQKDKWIEEVAEELNCEAIPLYKKKNICKLFNDELYELGLDNYYSDNLHESVAGQKVLGKIVAGEMSKYLW